MQYEAKIIETIQESPDAVTLRFTVGEETLPFIAGQYTTVRQEIDGRHIGKAYSLSSAPHDPYMSITVKRLGLFSNKLCDKEAGDTLTITKPYGFFNAQVERPIVAIAAGVGIAPIWSIIRDELSHDQDRGITLLHTGAQLEDIIFHEQSGELCKAARFFTTRSSGGVERRIDITQDTTETQRTSATFYVCGSEDFVRSMWRALNASGVDESRIITETFFESAP